MYLRSVLIILILIIALPQTEATAQHRENFYGIRYDYTLHFETGMVASIVIDQWNKHMFNIGEDYGLLSIGIPILMGVAKEYHDFKYGDQRIREDAYYDLGFTVLGALTGKMFSLTF